MATLYIVGGLMAFMGIGIKYFKWYFLIAGYNTMNKDQKNNVDTVGLGKLMGNFLILMAILIIGGGIADEYGYKFLSMMTLLLIVPLTIAIVFLAQKYDHNRNTKSRKLEKKVFIGFMIITIIAVSSLLIYGSKEAKVEIMEDRIVISGIYGTMIKKENITEITLEDSIPRVLNKVNGFDMGYVLRGVFAVEGMGSGSIYIHENKSPYVFIKAGKKFFIINYKDGTKTRELYEKLK